MDGWRAQGSFQFPVGGTQTLVHLGAALIEDISSFRLSEILPKLSRQAAFLHGSDDKVELLCVLIKTLALTPPGLASITDFPGEDHGLSSTEMVSTHWTAAQVRRLVSGRGDS